MFSVFALESRLDGDALWTNSRPPGPGCQGRCEGHSSDLPNQTVVNAAKSTSKSMHYPGFSDQPPSDYF